MINLFNLGDGKTRTVINYIEKIEAPISFTVNETEEFMKTKEKALQHGLTANEMLDIIGYSPTELDKICVST